MTIARRDFLKQSSILATGSLLLNTSIAQTISNNISKVKIGLIGVGLRGQNHLDALLRRTDVEVTAIADPDLNMISKAINAFEKVGASKPVVFSNGNYDYKNLVKSNDVDAVIISTPWEWHAEQTIDAVNAQKIPGVEVCGAIKLADCWDIVNASEKTGVPVMILENVCYRRDILAVFNMVKKGFFGELLHMQGGYQHDLRGVKFNDGVTPYNSGVEFGEKGYSEAKWRTQHSIDRNGELYPTHGLGPIAVMLDINRGNRLTKLSSVATKSMGLHKYIVSHKKGGEKHPNAAINFKLGDIVTTQIQTANQETIILTHDTNNPRPYNLGFRVQGTDGIWQDYSAGQLNAGFIYLEGKSKPHKWENPEPYLTENDHAYWEKFSSDSNGAGHGGMDFFVINDFIHCIKTKTEFPLDVYDLATYYAITPLSEKSIESGGKLMNIPDFTRGKWKTRQPIFGSIKY